MTEKLEHWEDKGMRDIALQKEVFSISASYLGMISAEAAACQARKISEHGILITNQEPC